MFVYGHGNVTYLLDIVIEMVTYPIHNTRQNSMNVFHENQYFQYKFNENYGKLTMKPVINLMECILDKFKPKIIYI